MMTNIRPGRDLDSIPNTAESGATAEPNGSASQTVVKALKYFNIDLETKVFFEI